MRYFLRINIINDTAVLDDGVVLPIVGYYDFSKSAEQVDKFFATHLITGDDDYGYYNIHIADFEVTVIH